MMDNSIDMLMASTSVARRQRYLSHGGLLSAPLALQRGRG
jgi:hypothetical protein